MVSKSRKRRTASELAAAQREISGSLPNAWIWSRFNSACSSAVVRQTARPSVSTSTAISTPLSTVCPNSWRIIRTTYSYE